MYSVSTQAEEGWVILGYSHITLVCAHANYAFRRRMQAEAATFAVMVIKESAVIVKCMILGGGWMGGPTFLMDCNILDHSDASLLPP